MPEVPAYETRSGLPPVEGTLCSHHDAAMKDVYAEIKTRVGWRYVLLLSSVAALFGVSLWLYTDSRCTRVEEVASSVGNRVIKIETDVEHIKGTQVEVKAEQMRMREEMRHEFTRLRELIKNGN